MISLRMKPLHSIILLCLTLVLGLIIVYKVRHRQPTYQGRTFYEWAKSEARILTFKGPFFLDLLRELDPYASERLLTMIQEKDPRWKVRLEASLNKQPFVRFHICKAEENRELAIYVFEQLGPEGSFAIPNLMAVLGDKEVGLDAAAALGAIGPMAIEPLRRALLDHGTQANAKVALDLIKLGAKPEFQHPFTPQKDPEAQRFRQQPRL